MVPNLPSLFIYQFITMNNEFLLLLVHNSLLYLFDHKINLDWSSRKPNRLLMKCSHFFFQKHFIFQYINKENDLRFTWYIPCPGLQSANSLRISGSFVLVTVLEIKIWQLSVLCSFIFSLFVGKATRKYKCIDTHMHTNICKCTCSYIYIHGHMQTHIHVYILASKIMNSHQYLQLQSIPSGFIFAFPHFIFVYPSFLRSWLKQPQNIYSKHNKPKNDPELLSSYHYKNKLQQKEFTICLQSLPLPPPRRE